MRAATLWVAGIAVLLILPLPGVVGGEDPAHSLHAGSAGPTGASGTSTGLASSGVAGETRNPGQEMAQSARSAFQAQHLDERFLSVPRPSATPAESAEARAAGHVSPLYTGTPAPMGVADFGLSAGPGGTVVASVLNSTSLRGQVNANLAGIHGLDLANGAPDSFTIQLNAVTTNVTLLGQSGYSFWTQDIALYYPSARQLYFITNVWNWSGGNLSSNAFVAHGPFGTQVDHQLYFAAVGPISATYPFALTFYLNSTLVGGRDAVFFSASVTSGAGDFYYPSWDFVVFNSTAVGGAPLAQPSNYTADGFHYNPVNLTDDFELIVGGPDNGAQTDLVAADAELGLAFWSDVTKSYEAVPSAYSDGGETGETATGAYVGWSNASGGPGNLSAYGVMRTGPSVISGLWNAGRAEGLVPVVLHLSPSNAFFFVNASANPYTISELEYAPTLTTTTLFLSPGAYRFTVELSDYSPRRGGFTVPPAGVGPPLVVHVVLPFNLLRGIYTPLFVWKNSQYPAVSYFGLGVPLSPYVVFNNQHAPLGAPFGVVNDYGYPVFPGILFVGTTASVMLFQPANFSTDFSGEFVEPYVNALPLWFAGVSHVALDAGTNVTGWFGSNLYAPPTFSPFDVVFYRSQHNLIAGNHFHVSGGGGLLLYGGGNNTVWGNSFSEVNVTGYNFSIPYGLGIGIEVAESFDLIYNNNVSTPTTAWQLRLDIYTVQSRLYFDRWNISVQAATNVHHAAGFPLVPLSGSIIGTSWQAGNFWWDWGYANPYNGAVNPIGVLPYTENAVTPLSPAPYIYPGGDYAPLNYVSPP